MAEKLSPFVFWGQKSDSISLKVDLREIVDPEVNITEDNLTFSSEGQGVQGQNKYQFHIDFYLPIDPEKSKYRITERSVEFCIGKKGDGEVWPRLTQDKIKYPWLKIDFDKVYYEESEEEETNEMMNNDEMMKQLEKELNLSEPEFPDWKTGYLFFYNLFQFIGFAYITIALLVKYFRSGEEALKTGFETVGTQLMVAQAVAILEIIHPLVGLVKTSAIAPFLQVVGRNFSLFVILHHEPRMHTAPAVFCLFFVWSAIECVRYPFYMLSVFDVKVSFITWMRYTAWIPLYPLGILLEGTVGIMAIPLYEETQMFSLRLPNSVNMAFYFPYLLHVYLIGLLLEEGKHMRIVKHVALRLRLLMEEREIFQNMSNQTNIPNSELSETNKKITNSLTSVKGLSVVKSSGGYKMLNYMYSQRKKVLGVGRKPKSS